MGSNNMNKWLADWTKRAYPDSKRDLCTCFIERGQNLTIDRGYEALITSDTCMYISSFEQLRKNILSRSTIVCFIDTRGTNAHPDVFDANAGWVLHNAFAEGVKGSYFKLNQAIAAKEAGYLEALANPECGWVYRCEATDFDSIPGSPIAYWSGSSMNEAFKRCRSLAEVCAPKAGLSTADNERFLRFWWEVTNNDIAFDSANQESMKLKSTSRKWFPMTKGGTYRKWFGNNEYILNFKNDGEELKYWLVNNPKDPSTTSYSRYIRNYDKYCEAGISFSDVSSGQPHFRRQPSGYIPNARGPYLYTDSMVLLAFLNSSVTRAILEVLAPTLTFNVGDLAKLPIAIDVNPEIEEMVEDNISIAEKDWDAFEASWHFKKHPLC